jgi:iron complex outermembrane receptor protein
VTLAQRELVSSVGVYLSDDIQVFDRISMAAGIRADRVRFEVKDQFVTTSNADDSGDRVLAAVSPVVGIVGRLAQTHSVYANFSSAFETPTATELGNHADGTAGINPDLDPQHSYTVEGGAKGWVGTNLRYDAAIFDTHVRDELIPFEIPGSNGRRYFRNAGRTRRRGAEVSAEVGARALSVMLAYSYSRFEFTRYESAGADLSGNEIPGIPRHRLQSALRARVGRAFAVVENETAGRTYVDDANTSKAPAYAVSSARVGSEISFARARATVVFGVQNVFDRVYSSSLAVNAARGKYFEPAPGRTLFLGLSMGTGLRR